MVAHTSQLHPILVIVGGDKKVWQNSCYQGPVRIRTMSFNIFTAGFHILLIMVVRGFRPFNASTLILVSGGASSASHLSQYHLYMR